MSDRVIGQLLEELRATADSQKELYKIKRMFGWGLDKDGFVEHMQKWKDAQPLTNMSVVEKLDELWGLADEVNSNVRGLQEECESAQSAIEECSYYTPSDDAEDLQRKIRDLMDEIQTPKKQAEADMEDSK